MKVYKNAMVFFDGQFVQTSFAVENGKFVAIDKDLQDENAVDLTGKYVIPGLVDRHTHGSFNVDFNLLSTEEEMTKVLDYYKSCGVTSVFPTLLSDNDETTIRQLGLIADMMPKFPMIKGIHLEGPFLCLQYKGAMPPQFLKNPDIELFKKYQDAAKGNIKILTISPELPNALELISYISQNGVTASIGHSNATYEEALAGVQAGAKVFTHFLNATRLFTQHEPGVMGAGLMSQNTYVEQICDYRHITQNSLKVITSLIPLSRICAVTDSIMAGGLPDGQYRLGANDVIVEDGDAKLLHGGSRAGSTLKAIDGVRNLFKTTGDLYGSIKAMTENPAKLQGIFQSVGSIEVGKDADFIVFEDLFKDIETYSLGE